MCKILLLAILSFIMSFAFAVAPAQIQQLDVEHLKKLEQLYLQGPADGMAIKKLKVLTFSLKHKSVPLLIKVMKEERFPEKSRWHATFLLGQIMGKKSAPFIAKFADHPAWMMRVAALKSLTALNQKEYVGIFRKGLKDNSLIVRVQALDSISHLKMRELSPAVWAMMYDQSNYSGQAGSRKRTSIVKAIIRTLGDLQYAPAAAPMAKLIQNSRYHDLMDDLDYSLEKITGRVSPDGTADLRKKFWKAEASPVAVRKI